MVAAHPAGISQLVYPEERGVKNEEVAIEIRPTTSLRSLECCTFYFRTKAGLVPGGADALHELKTRTLQGHNARANLDIFSPFHDDRSVCVCARVCACVCVHVSPLATPSSSPGRAAGGSADAHSAGRGAGGVDVGVDGSSASGQHSASSKPDVDAIADALIKMPKGDRAKSPSRAQVPRLDARVSEERVKRVQVRHWRSVCMFITVGPRKKL